MRMIMLFRFVAVWAMLSAFCATAFGNPDGDLQMLQWTTAGQGRRFALLVHHTDAEREFAYDKGASKALDEAQAKGWTVVDMKRDWKVIYPPAK
jgi:hypothetical protein